MTSKLDQIRITSPCKESWDSMRGDDCVRFCQSCRQNVRALTRAEAELGLHFRV